MGPARRRPAGHGGQREQRQAERHFEEAPMSTTSPTQLLKMTLSRGFRFGALVAPGVFAFLSTTAPASLSTTAECPC